VSVLIKEIVIDDDGVVSLQFVKHSNSRLSELPPKAQIRHFHEWVKNLTGIPKGLSEILETR
jgi:hypothetical protein